jgi:hypothetical protein
MKTGATGVARLLLVLTCLAPVAIVQGAVEIGEKQYRNALLLLSAVILLVLVCLGVLWGVRQYDNAVPKRVTDPAPKETEPLAFLVSYALPLIAAKEGSTATVLGLVAFMLVMALAVWQLQVFHVNPLLAIFGYKFFSAKSEGMPVLLLTRQPTLTTGVVRAVRVSEYLWLVTADGDKKDGSAPDDST